MIWVMYHREMPLSTRFIKAIKWLVAWIMLIIYYLKSGNFAEYDILNAVGISLPFYIAMYRIFFNNIDELINIRYMTWGGTVDSSVDMYNLLTKGEISEALWFDIKYVGAVLLCVSETFFLNWLLLKILPIIG